MFVKDIEEHLRRTGSNGIDLGIGKLFILLYADDGGLLSESAQGLQSALDSLYKYCTRWKLPLNVKETKIMIFRKSGKKFYTWFYDENSIEIVNTITISGNSVLVYWFFLGSPISFSTTRQESVVLFKKQNQTIFRY